MPKRSSAGAAGPTAQLPCRLEAAALSEGSLAKKLQEALLLAKLEDFQQRGVKALPLSATSCKIEFHKDVQTAFTVVEFATNYDFSNLASLEVDEPNAQQFVEQLGPGKRPLWAVPVILRPKNAELVLVFACVFRESGSVRSHMAKSSALKELKHWTLRNSKQLQVTFLASDVGQQVILGGPTVAVEQMPKIHAVTGPPNTATAAVSAERAERELLQAEEKEKAKQLKRGQLRRPVYQVPDVATSPGSESETEIASTSSSEVQLIQLPVDGVNQASILQLLSGWLSSVRAEESCHKVVNASYWHYRRNENACWRMSHQGFRAQRLSYHLATSSACASCSEHQGFLCSCRPNPWMPLPELEPDGREPQLLLAMTVEPPGLEPELSDTSLWRHLLRGTHGFSLHGPQPVSLFPEAPELARTARLRQQNAGWRRWWLSWKKLQRQEASLRTLSDPRPAAAAAPNRAVDSMDGAAMVLMPVPVHLCWKVQQYIEHLQREEWASKGLSQQMNPTFEQFL